MATIYQVSELAGVSLATVSRVMNNNARVSDKTKEKVLSAMAELGYQPNAIAQSLASNCSNSVGVLVSELHGPFFGDMMSAIEQTLRSEGKHAIIASGHSNADTEQASIEFLISRKCDALILHVEAVSDVYLIDLAAKGVSFVLINRYIEQISTHCICLDNQQGGYLATQHVLDLQHAQVAYISGPSWKQDAQARLNGHKLALQDADIAFDNELVFEGDYQQQSGSAGLDALLGTGKAFSAIICANDEMASGVMTRARELNLDIPEQLSIVGFDNIIYASYLYPTLTTVDYPIFQMGKMAANYILAKTYDKSGLVLRDVFVPKLEVRQSSKLLA
ncbi:LacI family DNA-binding transcriptional regulator [Pseudoalteromonas aurantia]|uniref:LacI family transcriptional regulator n=1 Tax=Pseudoalteromonas aurantia TaxID=43654 RepID=A0A5S3V3X0_9GAMM|nr:LacI family DNA-binding transcriptional regulator [Pseudoalteromonas aurantia]TMO59245.1 LacI family transcriptional regulator [Pseudoalteromonas aurantia]TMO65659.1 LacI family transcriptional regulator [Pseudoalteromonas aurantia]TMO78318.1 LacI family transcriptional regulator [Pseudoalteromonas aurantia]